MCVVATASVTFLWKTPSLDIEMHSLTCRADAVQKEPVQVILVDTDSNQLCINHDLIVRDFAVAAIPSSVSDDGDSGTGTDHSHR